MPCLLPSAVQHKPHVKLIGSPSISMQVHRATSHDGQQLAVKVQHAGLRETAAADVATIEVRGLRESKALAHCGCQHTNELQVVGTQEANMLQLQTVEALGTCITVMCACQCLARKRG